jgi:hypothetical protein
MFHHNRKSKSILSLEDLRGLRSKETVSIPIADAMSISFEEK